MAIVTKTADTWTDTNKTNVKAIITNLETILSSDLGYNLEYEMRDDPDVDTTPSMVLHYEGEDFEENFGEQPKYNEIKFLIIAQFRESDPDEIRDRTVDIVHDIRGGVTIDNLNVGALADNQIVSRVNHESNAAIIETPIIVLGYNLLVRYREINDFG